MAIHDTILCSKRSLLRLISHHYRANSYSFTQGKSEVVLALIAANRLPPEEHPTLNQIQGHHFLRYERLKLKTTVIFTSVSLLGQWEHECRKHAPGLKVARHHPTSKSRITRENFFRNDVIISSSTFEWKPYLTEGFEFHRVIVDESHLFATLPALARVKNAIKLYSSLKWCVTVTPFATGLGDLSLQLVFLNSSRKFWRNDSLEYALENWDLSIDQTKKQAFYTLAIELKQCMIRHCKTQNIHGSQAWVLPESTATTVYMDMTPYERKRFAHAHESEYIMQRMRREGAKTLNIEKCFAFRFKDVAPEQGAGLSKIKALVDDLRQLKITEPSFRAVVYMQSLAMHRFCCERLRTERLNVFEFSGSTLAFKRDEAIRGFQNQADHRPSVFVITLRSGNVVITLTAASRVYILEPSMDPAAEVQASGRIHRIGQDKPVQVKKFVFRNCIESNIVKLHKEIAASRVSISDGFFPPRAVQILSQDIRPAPLSEKPRSVPVYPWQQH